jgi:hypothetical protein
MAELTEEEKKRQEDLLKIQKMIAESVKIGRNIEKSKRNAINQHVQGLKAFNESQGIEFDEDLERAKINKELEETTVPAITNEFKPIYERKAPSAAPPITVEPPPGFKPTLLTAASKQSVIPKGRAEQTRSYDITKEGLGKFLEDNGMSPKEATLQAGIAKDIIDNYQAFNKNKSAEEALQFVFGEIDGISNPAMIEEEDTASKNPYIRAFENQTTPGKIPNYTPTQEAFLKELNKARVDEYVEKNIEWIKNSANKYRTITLKNGSKYEIADEVYQYMKDTTLPPVIISEFIDKAILEGKADFTTHLNPNPEESQYQALAKVKAYKTLGGDEWFLDAKKKKEVLGNLEKYSSDGGIIWDTKTALGGTAESTGSWLLRSSMIPYNLVAGAVVEATDTEELARLKADQRAKNEPLYAGYPVLANIALNKGFTGEAQEAADALRVEDPFTRLVIVGGGFAADILDPSLAITLGAGKAVKTAAQLRKYQKIMYGAADSKKIAETAGKVFASTVLDDFNLISLGGRYLPDSTKKALKGAQHGDLRLHMSDDLADSLQAQEIAAKAPSYLEARRLMREKGIDKSTYSKLLEKGEKTEGFAPTKARLKNEMLSSKASKELVSELGDTQKFLDDVAEVGVQQARKNADNANLHINKDFTDEVLRIATGKGKAARISAEELVKAKTITNKHFARGIVFQETPNMKGLENIVAVTRNTWAHTDNANDLLAASIKTNLGSTLAEIGNSGKVGRSIKPATTSFSTAAQMGAGTIEGTPENFFKLSREQAKNISKELEYLPIPKGQKKSILESLREGKLYFDDQRMLIDANIDQFAKGENAITSEDISRLSADQQARMLEPAGVAQRTEGFTSAIQTLYSKASKKIFAKQNKASINISLEDISINQKRLVQEIQQESSMLDTKAKRSIDGLVGSKEVRALYVNNPELPITKIEALGVIIVGAKQGTKGVTRQKGVVAETLNWAFARLFYDQESYRTITDGVFGINKLYDNDLLTVAGKKLLKEDIARVSSKMVENPRQFWSIFDEFITDWTAKVSSGMIDGERIVKTNIRPRSLAESAAENLTQAQKELKNSILLGMYFDSESKRIRDRALIRVVDQDFKPTTTNEIFKGAKVSDEFFQESVKQSILDSFNVIVPYQERLANLKARGIPTEVARKAIEYGDVIMRKNNLADYIQMDVAGIRGMLDDLFGGANKDFAKAIFGKNYYNQINQQIMKGRATSLTANLDTLLQGEAIGMRGWYAVKKWVNNLAAFRYFNLLGARPRFHGGNVVTAPVIMYATTGKILNPSQIKDGFDVAFYASNPAARKVNEIAVRTKSGKVYTYGDIYENIRTSGVRSASNFVTTSINDGALLNWLNRDHGKGYGFGENMKNWIKGAPEVINDLTMQEDMVFRAGIMIQALQEGRSIEEATHLARRSLFDYNDMSAVEKGITGYAFVFYAFMRQNLATLVYSFDKPKMFKRYVNVLKFDRGAEALAAELNDGKKFPHQAFFPGYTLPRTVLSVSKGQGKDYYTMTPSLPPIDAILLAGEIAVSVMKGDIGELVQKQLSPENKAILGLQSSFKTKRIPSEYINMVSFAYSDQPADIANLIQKVVGGSVIPTAASEENGAVGGYIYEMDEEQQHHWNEWVKWWIDYPGIGTPAKDWSKVFDTEGTTYQKLTPTQKAAARLGFITPTAIAPPEQQDIWQLLSRKRVLDEKINNLKNQKKARIKQNQQNQPEE